MMKYNSRQRIIASLEHREADMVPFDFGGTRSTGINALAYYKLREYVGIKNGNVKIYDLRQLLADIEPEIGTLFGSDCIQLHRMAPSCGLKIDRYKPERMMDGNIYDVPAGYNPVQLPDKSTGIADSTGRIVMKRLENGLYFDDVYAPLATVTDEKELDLFAFPSISADEINYLAQRGADLYTNTEYAIVAPLGISIFEKGIKDFGYEEWLMRILIDEPMIIAYLERLAEAYIKMVDAFAEKVGRYVQVVQGNDDLGMQNAPLIPPDVYRSIFKPFHQRIFHHIKKKMPHVYILLHSCGSIYDLIPDLIEAGVDALNPVQINAEKMEPNILKQEFGKDVTFWGGGISTQSTLSFGSMDEIIDEVRRMMDIFADGGGFVFCPVHNIQADVSPEKIVNVFDTAKKIRNYSKNE
jgi:uroporphyrinogen decarboxylase